MALETTVDTRPYLDRLSKMPTFGFTSILLRLSMQCGHQVMDEECRPKLAQISQLNEPISGLRVDLSTHLEAGKNQWAFACYYMYIIIRLITAFNNLLDRNLAIASLRLLSYN
jgi:hypothetical protein